MTNIVDRSGVYTIQFLRLILSTDIIFRFHRSFPINSNLWTLKSEFNCFNLDYIYIQGVLDLRRHRHTTIRLTRRHPYDTFSSYDATPSRRRFATYWLWSYDCALLNKVSYILKGEGKLNEKFGIDFEE